MTDDLPEPSSPYNGRPFERAAAITIIIAGSVILLQVGKNIVLPVILSILLYFLLGPLVRWLTTRRIPRVISSAGALGLFTLLGCIAVWSLASPAGEWLERLPGSVDKIQEKINVLRKPVQQVTDIAQTVERATSTGDSSSVKVTIANSNWTESIITNTQSLASNTVFALILTFFLLTGGDEVPQRISKALASKKHHNESLTHTENSEHRRNEVIQTIYDAETAMSSYLLTVTLINLGLGTAVGIGCWAINMPNPLLWGCMAFVLNFIPYFGAIFGIIILTFAGILSFDTLTIGLMPAFIYLVLNLIEAELLTPLALKKSFSLDPVATLIWTSIWLWLWGIPGGILAVPILILITVLFRSMSVLQPLLIMIAPKSNNPDGNSHLPAVLSIQAGAPSAAPVAK